MWPKQKNANHKHYRYGFTIVELLIVIVVIGILVTIIVVAYNGIQIRAQSSTAQADAVNASKLLAQSNILSGSYPSDLSTVNNGGPLPATDGSTYQYRMTNNGANYCLTVTNKTSTYKVSDANAIPTAGGCPGDGVGGVAAITNLAPNPSFEAGSTGWTFATAAGYTGAVSTNQKYSGNSSYSITVSSTVADRYLETYVTVPAGKYTTSAYVYLTSSGATAYDRDTMLNCGTGTCTSAASPLYDRSKLNQWQRVQNTTTVTSSSATLRLRFYGPTDGITYVDGVMVVSGSAAPAYADGNTANWIWNSTTNNSTSTGPTL